MQPQTAALDSVEEFCHVARSMIVSGRVLVGEIKEETTAERLVVHISDSLRDKVATDIFNLPANFFAPARRVVGSLGKCMYCGSTESLSDEHVLPFGLAGSWVLEEASCESCRRATQRVEYFLQRQHLFQTRGVLDLPTRRPAERPTHVSIVQERSDGTQTRDRMALSSAPALLIFPIVTHARFVDPSLAVDSSSTDLLTGYWAYELFPGRMVQIARDYHVQDLSLNGQMRAVHFMQTVAKIGLGLAYAAFGTSFTPNGIAAYIIGDSEGMCEHVRCIKQHPAGDNGSLHIVKVCVEQGAVVAYVRLFALFGSPIYAARVGSVAGGTLHVPQKLYLLP
jgi:hypothetical protein